MPTNNRLHPFYTPDSYADLQTWYYNQYRLDNKYTYDSGLLTLPVAGPDGSPPRVIKTHASIGYRTCKFLAHKSGNPPVFPAIGADTASGDIFLHGNLNVPLPDIGTDQSRYDFRADGEYVFVQPGRPRGSSSDDTFHTGIYPFVTPLVNFWKTISPSYDAAGNAIRPDIKRFDWRWTSEDIAAFFMGTNMLS